MAKSRLFLAPSDQYIYRAKPAGIAPPSPLTMACWAFPLSTAGNAGNALMVAQNTASATAFFRMARATANSKMIPSCRNNASAIDSATPASLMPLNQWLHCGVVLQADAKLACWIGGVKEAVSTGVVDGVFTLDQLMIGAHTMFGATNQDFDGYIFWPAVWNVALLDAEMAQLAAGADPSTIRNANLISFPDLETLVDQVDAAAWTNIGSTIADPPPWYVPPGPAVAMWNRRLVSSGQLFNGGILSGGTL